MPELDDDALGAEQLDENGTGVVTPSTSNEEQVGEPAGPLDGMRAADADLTGESFAERSRYEERDIGW
jgi:hypothetical protein